MKDSLSLTVDRNNWISHASPSVDPTQWSAVIAAAGRGSRLGYDKPKILFPLAGRSILAWLLDLLLPYCQTVILVVSPDGRRDIEPELERLAPGRFRIVIQPEPTGMGSAVELGVSVVETPHTAVLWGDQVAIEPASVETVLRLHQGPFAPDLTIPTVIRTEPYIHFARDQKQCITALHQAREGDKMPTVGESDAGFFCFRTNVLLGLLDQVRVQPEARGRKTDEFNLLPVIPFAARHGYRLMTPQVMKLEETVGINSRIDAERVEPFLRSRHGA